MRTKKIIPSDIRIIILSVFITVIYINVPDLSFPRTWLEFAIELLIPGYVLTAAMFLRINQEDILRIGLSFILSFIIVFELNPGLNYTPWEPN